MCTMKMLASRLFLASTLLVHVHHIVIAQNDVAEEIANLSISGWWSDCDYNADNSCAGTFHELLEPAPLDPSGNTCYVNPHVDSISSTKSVVFWLGSPISEVDNETSSDVFLYTLRVDNSTLLPTNCTESGACSCESVDSLRDPWRVTGMCSGECRSTPADDLLLLSDDECAVLYKESVINPFFNDTIVTCAIQGALMDASPSSPSEAPNMEEPTSGAGLVKTSLTWMVCVGLSGLFACFAKL